jgi:hypothetical protein
MQKALSIKTSQKLKRTYQCCFDQYYAKSFVKKNFTEIEKNVSMLFWPILCKKLCQQKLQRNWKACINVVFDQYYAKSFVKKNFKEIVKHVSMSFAAYLIPENWFENRVHLPVESLHFLAELFGSKLFGHLQAFQVEATN